MLTDGAIRNEVWLSRWDAEALARYYETLHRRLEFRFRAAVVPVVLAGLAVAVGEIGDYENASKLAGAMLAAASVWMACSALPRNAALAHAASVQCAQLALELKGLLYSFDAGDQLGAETMRELARLQNELLQVTARPGVAGFTTNGTLRTKTYEEAREVMTMEYQHA